MNKFIQAVTALDLDMVRSMVKAKPEWLAWSEPSGKNALHFLCGRRGEDTPEEDIKSLELLKFFLKNGMDIDSLHRIDEKNCDSFPATPLWYAYTRGRKEVLWKYLLKKGADPSHCWWAIAWYDDIAAAKFFLQHGAELGKNPSLNDLFIGSFGWKKFGFAYWLLSRGADVNAGNSDGNTALIVAVKRKDDENIRRLIKSGADPDKKNSKGESARSIAASKGPKRLLTLLP